jgi:hypothetical protein
MELVDEAAADAGYITREFRLPSGRAAPSVWLVSLSTLVLHGFLTFQCLVYACSAARAPRRVVEGDGGNPVGEFTTCDHYDVQAFQ